MAKSANSVATKKALKCHILELEVQITFCYHKYQIETITCHKILERKYE